jgi:5-methylcytosine-specific restriction endonuclease McrA
MARVPISPEVERRVREAAKHRCGYCLSQQQYMMAKLTIEHVIPRSAFSPDDPVMHAETNLWLSCGFCNGHKSDKTHAVDPVTGDTEALFNPRTQAWADHFRWSEDGLRVMGLTATGRATVVALHLDNDPDALAVRANWVSVGWHPPQDA